jgi:hypothetical protein
LTPLEALATRETDAGVSDAQIAAPFSSLAELREERVHATLRMASAEPTSEEHLASVLGGFPLQIDLFLDQLHFGKQVTRRAIGDSAVGTSREVIHVKLALMVRRKPSSKSTSTS